MMWLYQQAQQMIIKLTKMLFHILKEIHPKATGDHWKLWLHFLWFGHGSRQHHPDHLQQAG